MYLKNKQVHVYCVNNENISNTNYFTLFILVCCKSFYNFYLYFNIKIDELLDDFYCCLLFLEILMLKYLIKNFLNQKMLLKSKHLK